MLSLLSYNIYNISSYFIFYLSRFISIIGGSTINSRPATALRTPLQEDIVMQEARNQRALREMTPMTMSMSSK